MNIQPLTTPIPIIDKTELPINIEQALLTAMFAVISGFLLYLLKCIVDGYWLRYLRDYKKLKAETEYTLRYYANAYMNIVEEMDDWHKEASDSIRKIGSRIGAFAIEKPKICFGVPDENVLEEVSSELIRLSNSMRARGDIVFDMLEKNEGSTDRVRKLLKLKKDKSKTN